MSEEQTNTLSYIDELGIGQDPEVSDTEAETNETIEESSEDFVQDSEENTSDNTSSETDADSELLKSLQGQIEGMEKRIADKDAYINELRESSKQKEVEKQQELDTKPEESDFWDDPDKVISMLREELKQQKETSRIQQLQTAEIHYANTVDDYWKTVNPDALKEAVSRDNEFAEKFNGSNEPYRIAYEYLKEQNRINIESKQAEKNRIIQEYLAENGITEKKSKEVPPNINSGGKSASTSKEAPSDGFAAVFGSAY